MALKKKKTGCGPLKNSGEGSRATLALLFYQNFSVSARMRPCGIPANRLRFPHISKHGTPDLELKNDPPGWLSGERVGLMTWWL